MARRLLCLALFLLVAATVSADRTLVIERFDAVIDVSPDGSIVVDETIVPALPDRGTASFAPFPSNTARRRD